MAPAAIVLLGDRLDSLDVRRLFRRILGRPEPTLKAVEENFWYRSTKFVMRRSIPIGLAIVTLLLLLGAPFLGAKWGFPDDRVLPLCCRPARSAISCVTTSPSTRRRNVVAVIPDTSGVSPQELEPLRAQTSPRSPASRPSRHLRARSSTAVKNGPPTAATGVKDGSVFMTIISNAPLFTDASESQLDQLRTVSTPADKPVELTGVAQINRDSSTGITDRLPLVLAVIAAITFVLLFLLTGSLVLPLKALVLNVLSLTAAFGALVWIFQEGHLGAFGTTPTGTLVANMPVLLFCIAFGLSMDYEVFLVSRIREYWLSLPGKTRADNDEAVALGLARTGRVVTAAALVMSISFAALIAAQVSFMRMFGVGLTLAIIVDATLVRMLLVPAFMHVLGRWNWWAPKPLARLHERIGISESPDDLIPPAEKRERAAVAVTETG